MENHPAISIARHFFYPNGIHILQDLHCLVWFPYCLLQCVGMESCLLEWSLYVGVVTVRWVLSGHCTLEWSLYVGVVTVRWVLCSAVLEFCDVLDKEYSDWPDSSMNLLKVQIAYQDLVQ